MSDFEGDNNTVQRSEILLLLYFFNAPHLEFTQTTWTTTFTCDPNKHLFHVVIEPVTRTIAANRLATISIHQSTFIIVIIVLLSYCHYMSWWPRG